MGLLLIFWGLEVKFMNKIVLTFLMLVSFNTNAFVTILPDDASDPLVSPEPMPMGPHMRSKYVQIIIPVVKPGVESVEEIVIKPIPGTTVWTSVKACFLADNTMLGRFNIKDTSNEMIYFLDMQQGTRCSELTHWDIPVHVQHPIRFRLRCNNSGVVDSSCNGWIALYAK